MSNIVTTPLALVLGLGIGLGVALGASELVRRDPTSRPDSDVGGERTVVASRDSDANRSLLQRLRALEGRQANLADQVGELAVASDNDEGGERESLEAELSPQEAEERAALKTESQLAVLEEQLGRETKDTAWSKDAERLIGDAVRASGLLSVQLTATECLSSLCRLELVFDDMQAVEAHVGGIPGLVPWPSDGFLSGGFDEELQRPKAVFYVAREGRALPAIETAAL